MIVGITGGIATGKSTVSRMFGEAGWQVVDADLVAKRVRDSSPVVKEKLVERFGPSIYPAGRLDVRLLGQIVFGDPAALADLNHLLQPLIRKAIVNLIGSAKQDDLLLDIPLLFEQGYQQLCDLTIVVATDFDIQYRRLVKRDSLSASAARQRIAAQMPLSVKIMQADWTIDNSDSRRRTTLQTEWLIDYLRYKNKE